MPPFSSTVEAPVIQTLLIFGQMNETFSTYMYSSMTSLFIFYLFSDVLLWIDSVSQITSLMAPGVCLCCSALNCCTVHTVERFLLVFIFDQHYNYSVNRSHIVVFKYNTLLFEIKFITFYYSTFIH